MGLCFFVTYVRFGVCLICLCTVWFADWFCYTVYLFMLITLAVGLFGTFECFKCYLCLLLVCFSLIDCGSLFVLILFWWLIVLCLFSGVDLFCVLVWFGLGLFRFSCGLMYWCFAFKFVCLMNLGLLIVACVFKFYTFVLNWLCFVGCWHDFCKGLVYLCLFGWYVWFVFICVLTCWFNCCFGGLCILVCVWRLYFVG